MIAVDTSACAAVLLGEPDAEAFLDAMYEAGECVVGAPTEFELRLVLYKRIGAGSAAMVDALFARANVRVAPFKTTHAGLAAEALARFGSAPTWLNYGNCMCYAVAKALDLPLLYKGYDFDGTDLRSVPIGA